MTKPDFTKANKMIDELMKKPWFIEWCIEMAKK